MINNILLIIVSILTVTIVSWALFVVFIEILIRDYTEEEKDEIRRNILRQ